MQNLLKNMATNMIDRGELEIFKGQFSWFLHVDLLVFQELSLDQMDYIALCMRQAFQNLELP
jgi:exosome complex RNA-binding protein Rrp42 (RNase PH superfamily)